MRLGYKAEDSEGWTKTLCVSPSRTSPDVRHTPWSRLNPYVRGAAPGNGRPRFNTSQQAEPNHCGRLCGALAVNGCVFSPTWRTLVTSINQPTGPGIAL